MRMHCSHSTACVVRWQLALPLTPSVTDRCIRDRVVEIAAEVSEVEESVARRSMELYLLGDVHSPYFLAENGEINDESLQNLIDSMVRQEILEEAPSLDEVRTHEYARRAAACL